MEEKDLRELRLNYKAAYTAYMQSVQALSEAAKTGVLPSAEVRNLEEQSLNELIRARRQLLDALHEHSGKQAPN